MTNLILLLVFLTSIGIGAAWIAGNPGQVTMHLGDYRIDTSFAVLACLAVFSSLAILLLYALLARLLNLPSILVHRRQIKHYRSGLTELTWSVAALAASDLQSAQQHTKKAEKLLGETPLTLLLGAQIAKSRGEDEKTQMLLEKMLDHKETEYLAARMLSESAGKKQLFPRALALAQRANTASPHEHAAMLSVVSLHVRMKQWPEALRSLDTSARKAGLLRSEGRRARGLILLAQAKALHEEGNDETALATARKSLSYLGDFAPAVIFTAECYRDTGNGRKAIALLQKAWKKTEHPDIAEALRSASINEPSAKRTKILDRLGGKLHDASMLWRCNVCGEAATKWDVHCPSCGSFDSVQSQQ